MTLLQVRCNPYGYGSDRGPKHLMGGVFGPEFAGQDLVLEDGLHGIGVCERIAAGYYVMQCSAGHTGPVMPLCGPSIMQDMYGERWEWPGHVAIIQGRMAATCTACVMPPESRALWEDQRRAEESLRRAIAARDGAAVASIKSRINDIGRAQVELTMRGLTPRRPMKLVEVS